MRHNVLLWILAVLTCASPVSAENRYNFSQFTHETGDFFTQPARWRGNDWLKLGLIAGGTALSMTTDQPVRNAVLRSDHRYYRSVPIEAGRIWGDWYSSLVVAAGFSLHGWLDDNRSSKKIAFELIQADLYSQTVTQVGKVIFGRARPYQGQGAFSYRPFNFGGIGFQSLPGGHNTEGWAMSTVLSRNAHSKVLKILAYSPALLTFVSRIYQDKHWTSDCVLGAAIGVTVGTWVVNQHEKKETGAVVSSIYPLTVRIRF